MRSSTGRILICSRFAASLAGVARRQIVTEFPVPGRRRPVDIAAGPDGNLWFTESPAKIGRITTAGVVTEFPIPTAQSLPVGIAAGPDGNLWFTEYDSQPTRSGGSPPPASSPSSRSRRPTADPSASRPVRTATSGSPKRTPTRSAGSRRRASSTEFAIPTAGGNPVGIAAGPDGNLWFTDVRQQDRPYHASRNRQHSSRSRRRATPTALPPARTATSGSPKRRRTRSVGYTAGVFTGTFPLPRSGSANGIAVGADGNLWFTAGNRIGRITTAGVVTEFLHSRRGATAWAIAAGPDGNIWFTETLRRSDGSTAIGRPLRSPTRQPSA